MNHFVFLKIAEGETTERLLTSMANVLKDAKKVISGMSGYQILCSNDKQENSLLIHLTFESESAKDIYIEHPLHQTLLKMIRPVIIGKSVFDGD